MTETSVGERLRAERRVVPERLRWVCGPEDLPAPSSALEVGLGQERAISAITLSASMSGPGYNIYAAGYQGSGRTRATKSLLTEIAATRPVPPDRVYVHNFVQPDQPRLITLAPGRGSALRRSLDRLIEVLRMLLPTFFDDEIVEGRRRAITDSFQARESGLFGAFAAEAESKGFSLVKVTGSSSRPEVAPVVAGEPVPFEQLHQLARDGKLTEDELKQKEANYGLLRNRLANLVREVRTINRELNEALEKMVREEAAQVVALPMADVEDEFEEETIRRFLRHVREDVIDLLAAPFRFGSGEPPNLDEYLSRYRVNLVADRSGLTGAPVVVENFPTMLNLFGGLSWPPPPDGGPPRPPSAIDIVGGSILQADGGFLILRARDVVREPGVWEALKRTLSTSLLELQRPVPLGSSPVSVPPLKPEPVPISVRVVLVGEPSTYDLLWNTDADFRSTFKVKAEFDPVITRSEEVIAQFSAVLDGLCHENALLPLTPDGTARILEFSARRAGGRGKILARFGEMEDLLREADYEARVDASREIGGVHVEAALAQRRIRNGRVEERALELMADNVIRIEVGGERVGQVNGLSVVDLGYHRFGKPTRITATTSVGRAGIINIEREARLSGGIYDKGVLIITGWLRRRYAQERALTLTASVCFEQSYSGVDGDSASIAEIVALLSEMSGYPVDQSVAITGSVDQHGDLQPIGGLNEKVEGFFDVCASRGLTGRQGVMFPEPNVVELNLREDVAEEVEAGRFSLYALRSLEDALQMALGVTMEEIDDKVVKKLEAYGAALSEAAADLPPSPTVSIPVVPAPPPPPAPPMPSSRGR